jgi:hypothetical protein
MNPVSPVVISGDPVTDAYWHEREVAIAKDQPQFITLPAVYLYNDRCAMSRWTLSPEDCEKLRLSHTIFFYRWVRRNDLPQPSRLEIRLPGLEWADEPAPELWQSWRMELEPEVDCCAWLLKPEEARWVLTQGYVYMLVWNVHQQLMPTALVVSTQADQVEKV